MKCIGKGEKYPERRAASIRAHRNAEIGRWKDDKQKDPLGQWVAEEVTVGGGWKSCWKGENGHQNKCND